ncbi:MAG: MXAN_5187 C-terminal domain-containing protein [Candidatus Sulfotelmatobacter sp.]
MTTDEELNVLDSQLRRLKIEYEIFFSNPTKRPPTDIEWKVLSLLRKFSDGGRMNFSQRFRYNEMAQRYAIYSDLWRKKSRIREEGYRRPQDALLSVQGVRIMEEEKPQHPVYGLAQGAAASAGAASTSPETAAQTAPATESPSPQPFTLHSVESEREQVERLYNTLVAAKKKAGENVSGNFDSFTTFVQKKTEQIRKQYGCQNVEYSVEMAGGQVKLKAKAKA